MTATEALEYWVNAPTAEEHRMDFEKLIPPESELLEMLTKENGASKLVVVNTLTTLHVYRKQKQLEKILTGIGAAVGFALLSAIVGWIISGGLVRGG